MKPDPFDRTITFRDLERIATAAANTAKADGRNEEFSTLDDLLTAVVDAAVDAANEAGSSPDSYDRTITFRDLERIASAAANAAKVDGRNEEFSTLDDLLTAVLDAANEAGPGPDPRDLPSASGCGTCNMTYSFRDMLVLVVTRATGGRVSTIYGIARSVTKLTRCFGGWLCGTSDRSPR